MGRIQCEGGKAAICGTLALLGSAITVRASDISSPPLGGADIAPLQSSVEVAPFRMIADSQTRARATTCLATAIYYEAGNQTVEGRQAVAQVVLNRLRHPSYPKSVCGVVYQGAPVGRCQFTFACDGSLARAPDGRGWREAETIADQALEGFVSAAIGASTHYHTLWVHPTWSATMTPTRRIGAHQFYKMAGAALQLTGVYAGSEPAVFGFGAYPIAARAPAARMAAEPAGAQIAPRAAIFSAWGLQIAVVTPKRSGALLVSEADISPAPPLSPVAATAGAGASGS